LYASRKLIPREQNYSVGEREALSIIWAVSSTDTCMGSNSHWKVTIGPWNIYRRVTLRIQDYKINEVEFGVTGLPV